MPPCLTASKSLLIRQETVGVSWQLSTSSRGQAPAGKLGYTRTPWVTIEKLAVPERERAPGRRRTIDNGEFVTAADVQNVRLPCELM